jgi:hypothetical protein
MKLFFVNMLMLLSVTMAALSCSTGPNEFENTEYEGTYTVVVSGTASEKSTSQPLEGIKITLHAAEPVVNNSGEVRTMTVYTDNKGRFTLTAEGFTREISCTITSDDMKGIYEYGRQDMKIFWKGPSYDSKTGTFYVNDCDFYMEKLLQ